MTPIITFLNQKGGVGKTSLCHHLAGTLALSGVPVLLVDNDPQASLTQGLLGPAEAAAIDPAATVATLYEGGSLWPDSAPRRTPIADVDLIPGGRAVGRFNVAEPHLQARDLQLCLALELGPLSTGYGAVLIDCPPNLHLCSWAALSASTHVVVPLQAEDYGAQGIAPVREFIGQVRAWPNPGLALAGFVVTMYDRRASLPREYVKLLRDSLGPLVFDAVVPRLVDFPEAISRRKPVSHYRPSGMAAASMDAVAAELLGRISGTHAPAAAEPQGVA